MTKLDVFTGVMSAIIAFICLATFIFFKPLKEKTREKTIDLSKPMKVALVASIIIGLVFSYLCGDTIRKGDFSNHDCDEYLCKKPSTCKISEGLFGITYYYCSEHEQNGIDYYESTHSKVSSSSDKNTVECKSCHRKFNKGSDNAKSISRTNMCTNCYKNFDAAQKYLKEQPVK